MTFTNVLEMLDLAGIPLRIADRGDGRSAGRRRRPGRLQRRAAGRFRRSRLRRRRRGTGPRVPRPLQGAEARRGASRDADRARLRGSRASTPRRCTTSRSTTRNGLLDPGADRRRAVSGAAPHPRWISTAIPFPDRIIVPHGEIVHDRVSVEVMRGCPVGCRFCQAGYIYRPTRERDPNQVRDTVIRSVRATGYDQFSLSSLNTGEYGAIHPRDVRPDGPLRAGEGLDLALVDARLDDHARAGRSRCAGCASPASPSRPRPAPSGCAT